MAVIAVAGYTFTVSVAGGDKSEQITDGTITQTGTVVRTKTLAGVNFTQTDFTSAASLSFLYDGDAGLYNALSDAVTALTSLAIVITGGTGTFTGTMYPESVEITYDSAGVATASTSLVGTLVLS
jgi:hypothetical protein